MARNKSTIPRYKRRRRDTRSWPRRVIGWIVQIVVGFVLISVLWVLAYRFINPPITFNMIGDLLAGRGATHQWMPIGQIDRGMVDAAIAAEDGKFCSHHGFDVHAIEKAMQRNASGGRIRGGSTISQQTAKNAFLWNGGGYARKGAEAWFTFLIEHLWGKRRIMEVYLNLAETGVGTYGVNAGSERYFGHDSRAVSALEAARIAAVLPLPKDRGAIAPKGFTRRYGNIILQRIPTIARGGFDACVYRGTTPPAKKAPPPVTKKPRPLPGEEFESPNPLPPIDEAAAPPVNLTEPPAQAQPPAADQSAPAAQPQVPANST
jgi:monofunctional biosynthetic peptidoglycan transglycosylase